MKRYTCLLFDLDYTLLDFDADMTMAFEKLYESCGFGAARPYAPAMLDTYEKYNVKWWGIFEAGGCTKPELFRNRFADFLAETGLSGDPDEMNRVYFDFLGQGGVLYPGAEDLLKDLAAEYPIYIITNGNADTAKTRIKNSGVSRYIRGCFVSEAIGFAKPDARYFDYVFSHIPGVEKEKAVVIGDSTHSDILGAQNAGVDSIWYRSGDTKLPQGVSCTYQAASYDDILRILHV